MQSILHALTPPTYHTASKWKRTALDMMPGVSMDTLDEYLNRFFVGGIYKKVISENDYESYKELYLANADFGDVEDEEVQEEWVKTIREFVQVEIEEHNEDCPEFQLEVVEDDEEWIGEF